ncbi:MAG: alpha/beta hydrolase [Thermomicrobiales bacterium]
MPYATNDGVSIYYEREGSGPPIVLVIGLSMSLQDWRDFGVVGALRDKYELILVDPRGHGASDKPHNPGAYRFDKQAADIVAVLDHAGIERAVFWGYSLGGHIGFAAATYMPERFRAFIIGGSRPEARDPEPLHKWAESLRNTGIEEFADGFERHMAAVAPELRGPMRERKLTNDLEALAAVVIATGDAPSFSESLSELSVPMLLFAGDQDQPSHDSSQRAAAENPGVTFVSLPNFTHFQAGLPSDAIMPRIKEYLAAVTA